jgi:hypothetical protein
MLEGTPSYNPSVRYLYHFGLAVRHPRACFAVSCPSHRAGANTMLYVGCYSPPNHRLDVAPSECTLSTSSGRKTSVASGVTTGWAPG